MQLALDPMTVKGFLAPEEGEALYQAALAAAVRGPCLEIGAYCGRSALYLGSACASVGGVLFSLDHHRGSEENQPGWEWHDPTLWDEDAGSLDTLPSFRRTLRAAGLEDHVIALVGPSKVIAKVWQTPLSMLFIDGGHGQAIAWSDYRGWTPHIRSGGLLAIHDVFPDPADGGRPPFEIFQAARASGLFVEESHVMSLRLLRRI